MKKRLLSILTLLAMMISLLPTAVFAADLQLTIGTIQVDVSTSSSDVLGDGSGSVAYDASQKSLTLNNAVIHGDIFFSSQPVDGGLTIRLAENSVNEIHGSIKSDSLSTLKIYGKGTLSVTSEDTAIDSTKGILEIGENAIVSADGKNCALNSDRQIKILPYTVVTACSVSGKALGTYNVSPYDEAVIYAGADEAGALRWKGNSYYELADYGYVKIDHKEIVADPINFDCVIYPVNWTDFHDDGYPEKTVTLPADAEYTASVYWYTNGQGAYQFRDYNTYELRVYILMDMNAGKMFWKDTLPTITINGEAPANVEWQSSLQLYVTYYCDSKYYKDPPGGSYSGLGDIVLPDRDTSYTLDYTFTPTEGTTVIRSVLSYNGSSRSTWINAGDPTEITAPHTFTGSRTYRIATLVEKDNNRQWIYSDRFTVSIQDKKIESVPLEITAPERWAQPIAAADVAAGEGYRVTGLTWSPEVADVFQPDTEYTVSVALTAESGYVFDENTAFTINGQNAVVTSAAGNSAVIEYTFGKTALLPSAAVGDITLRGTAQVGVAADENAVITIADDTLADTAAVGTDVSAWFKNLPDGLSAGIAEIDGANVAVGFSGIPSAAAEEAMSIEIPASFLKSGRALAVNTNENARYQIGSEKQNLSISGLTYTSKAYDAQPIEADGTLLVQEDKVPVSALEIRYIGTGTTVYDSTDAPRNVGTYRVTYKIPDANVLYTGSVSYDFEITKAVPALPQIHADWVSVSYSRDPVDITAHMTGYDSDTMEAAGDTVKTDAGSYKVTVTLKDTANYVFANGETSVKLDWEITRAKPALPQIHADWVSVSYSRDPVDITAHMTGYDSDTMEAAGDTVKTDAGSYKVTVTLKDTANYVFANGETSVELSWEITRVAAAYDIPQNLTGTRGLKLSSVELPQGWSWEDGDVIMDEAGERSYSATFTPQDTHNYYGATEALTVTVEIHVLQLTLDRQKLTLYKGQKATLTAEIIPEDAPDQGILWISSDEEIASVDENGTVMALKQGTAVITAAARDGGCSASCTVSVSLAPAGDIAVYSIDVLNAANGNVVSSHGSACAGAVVCLTIRPANGYVLESITVTDQDNKPVKLTGEDGKYTFIMPASDVAVRAVFAAKHPGENRFKDVPAGSYYYDAVQWAVNKNITNGTSVTTFSPNGICTRAEAVTFLWRAAGSPAPKSAAMPFTDVETGAYYYDAVLWAVENSIANGTGDTTFSPNANCSRAQIITFLWRAQQSPAVGTLNPFTDVKTEAYYYAAILWAVEEKVANGTSAVTFSPNDNCTRGQIVTFIWRAMGE